VDFTGEVTHPNCDGEFCKDCPRGPVCLADCDEDEYLSEGTTGDCINCLATCETGCTNGENCEPCIDLLCVDCPNWETCDLCTPDSTEDLVCLCDKFYLRVNNGC
jgi:hypothetical protein